MGDVALAEGRRADAQSHYRGAQERLGNLPRRRSTARLWRELGEAQADQVIAYTMKCRVEPLDTATALLSADLHRQHRLATADAIVYATAVQHGAELLTCDAHFKGLPGVVLFPKAPER